MTITTSSTYLSAGSIVADFKTGLFPLRVVWSLALGRRLLGVQGLTGMSRWTTLVPMATGISLIGLACWPAIFGL